MSESKIKDTIVTEEGYLERKKKENENTSVGMILCASKDGEVVEYAIIWKSDCGGK